MFWLSCPNNLYYERDPDCANWRSCPVIEIFSTKLDRGRRIYLSSILSCKNLVDIYIFHTKTKLSLWKGSRLILIRIEAPARSLKNSSKWICQRIKTPKFRVSASIWLCYTWTPKRIETRWDTTTIRINAWLRWVNTHVDQKSRIVAT